MPVTPLINGVNYSWANISVNLFGVPVVGILAVEYTAKQKKENNYGAGQDPISRGYGNNEYEGSLEIYADTWQNIIAASPDRNPLAIPMFDITVTFGGPRVGFSKHVLRSCEFMENPFTGKQGDTKFPVKIPLIIASIEK